MKTRTLDGSSFWTLWFPLFLVVCVLVVGWLESSRILTPQTSTPAYIVRASSPKTLIKENSKPIVTTVVDVGGTFAPAVTGSKPAEFLTQGQLRQKQEEAHKKQQTR